MPHVWDMGRRLFDPRADPDAGRSGGSSSPARGTRSGWRSSASCSAASSASPLAVVMARFGVVRRGLLPYLVVSQTVPLIALAPLVVELGWRLHLGGWDWPRWLSVAVLGAFLAFFPVAVGTLRGLESAPATSLELMRSYAAAVGPDAASSCASRPRCRTSCRRCSWPARRR